MDETDSKIIVSEPQRISPDALANHAAAEPSSSETQAKAGHGSDISGRMTALTIGALGVVFGDIGTSPLYAMHNTVRGDGRRAARSARRHGARCR